MNTGGTEKLTIVHKLTGHGKHGRETNPQPNNLKHTCRQALLQWHLSAGRPAGRVILTPVYDLMIVGHKSHNKIAFQDLENLKLW